MRFLFKSAAVIGRDVQQPRPKVDEAAGEKARRREEAVKALDQ
jgi:hypothetical protein